MEYIRTHKDLDVWKLAVTLASRVYEVTARFPAEERFGLAAHMRRSCVSVASNIAEGAARGSRRDFVRFLYMAAGSASELHTQITIAGELRMATHAELESLDRVNDRVARMIRSLVHSLGAPDEAGELSPPPYRVRGHESAITNHESRITNHAQ